MQCLHCGVPLAIMRTLANGSFCSDEHRQLYEDNRGLPPSTESFPIPPPASGAFAIPFARRWNLRGWTFWSMPFIRLPC